MAIKIIDVSKHNGTINWSAVANSGIQAAFIRAGMAREVEPRFIRNISGAIAAGIPVGVYWFCYAFTPDEAIAEADACIRTIKPYNIALPVYYDFEYNTEEYANKNGIEYTVKSRTAIIKAFCERIRAAGYTPGVYSNPDYFTYKLRASAFAGYKIWLAAWTKQNVKTSFAETAANRVPSKYNADIWQFGYGTVSGVPTNCDLNYGYFDVSTTAEKPLQAGDTVRVVNTSTVNNRRVGRTYSGGKWVVYYDTYTVHSLSGNRAVLAWGKVVVAAVNVQDIEKV